MKRATRRRTLDGLGDSGDFGFGDPSQGASGQPADIVYLGAPLRYVDATNFYDAWFQWNLNFGYGGGDIYGFTPTVYPDIPGAQSDFVAGIQAGDDRTGQAALAAINTDYPNEIIPNNQTDGWNLDYVWGSSSYKSFALTLGRALGLSDAQTTATIGGLMAASWQASFNGAGPPFQLGITPLGAQFANALASVAGHAGDPTLVGYGTQLDNEYAQQRAIQGTDHGIFGGGFGAFLLTVATLGIASYALIAFTPIEAVTNTVASTSIGASDALDAATTGVSTVVDDAGQAVAYTAAVEPAGDATIVTAAVAPVDALPAADVILDPVVVTAQAVAPAALTTTDVLATTAVVATAAALPLDSVPAAPALDQPPAQLDPVQLDPVQVTAPLPVTPAPVVPVVPLVVAATGAALTAAAIGAQSGDPYYSSDANADGSQNATPLDAPPAPAGPSAGDLFNAAKTVVSVASTGASIVKAIDGSKPTVPGRAPVNPYVTSAGATPIAEVSSADSGGLFGGLNNSALLIGLGVVAFAIFSQVATGNDSSTTHRKKAAP